jgi:outer membrane protein assembly factor BamE (lipoprotein component of BamABCDE complex)
MNLPQTHRLFQKNRGLALALLILAAPFLVGGWEITMHKGINPSYVERIQDGKTKKSEILTLFGDPQETKRTSDGLIFVYQTYRTKEKSVSWKDSKTEEPKTAAAVDSPYSLEQTLKRKPKEGPAQEVSSALTIYFGSDGETVQSHDFKQY